MCTGWSVPLWFARLWLVFSKQTHYHALSCRWIFVSLWWHNRLTMIHVIYSVVWDVSHWYIKSQLVLIMSHIKIKPVFCHQRMQRSDNEQLAWCLVYYIIKTFSLFPKLSDLHVFYDIRLPKTGFQMTRLIFKFL